MGKRKKKDKSKGTSKPQPPDVPSTINNSPEEDKPFDFGGLPPRDLKKSLGCG